MMSCPMAGKKMLSHGSLGELLRARWMEVDTTAPKGHAALVLLDELVEVALDGQEGAVGTYPFNGLVQQ